MKREPGGERRIDPEAGMSDLFLPPYRILELCDLPGSFCGKVLADLGAEVVKIEPPRGDPDRHRRRSSGDPLELETSFPFLAYNTNKRSLALDVTAPRGREALLALVRNADALIETFSPGHLESLGLGEAALHAENPRLVVASITPYGCTGPRRDDLSSDLVAMATSGFLQVTGDPDGPPTRLGNEQSRFAPALYAAVGVVAALLHRDWHGGSGQRIDVSVQEALLSFILEQHPVLFWQVRRKNVTRVGPVSSLAVPAGVFPCQDGWVGLGIITAPEWDSLSRWLYDVTGREEILAEELRGGIHARAAHRDLIEAILLEFTTRQTRAEIFHEGQRRNLVVVPVNTVADLLGDEALAHGDFWKELDHPVSGRLRYPINLLGREVPTANQAAPLLGEANEEILCGELGWTRKELQELSAAGILGSSPGVTSAANASHRPKRSLTPGPRRESHEPKPGALAGLRVVEFGPFIALPLTGRLLAALGATVIKVETQKLLDPLNFIPPWGKGMGQPEYQALKRRITLDARTPAGAAVLKRLIAVSDVFMTNFRRDALVRWGIDLEDLRRRHPGLVVVHQSGFGAGPYESYKLYGIMAQHICGVSTMSGLPEAPPCCLSSAYSDYHTPLFQTLGVLGALDRRRRTGKGALIEGSILRSGACTVAPAILECQVSGKLPERRGNHDPIAVPHDVYPCAGEDQWCAIAVFDDAQWQKLCRALGREDWASDARFLTAAARREHEIELDAAIAEATRAWKKHDLMETLQRAGVPAGIVAKGEDLSADPQLESRQLYSKTTYYIPDAGRPGCEWERGPDVSMARLPLVFSDTPSTVGPYRRVGEDNDYVYREILGMEEGEIRTLTEQGVLT